MANRTETNARGPNRLQWPLRLIAATIPFAAWLGLELVLRLVGYGPNLDLFVPADRPGYMMTNAEVARRYFSRVERTPAPPYDVFAERKPENGYRIIVMGGSTAAGWPYPPQVAISRNLASRLREVFPSREIEVVNIGIAAVNSFTLRDLVGEVLAARPDAVLIYAGHNEYYGALGAASVESTARARWITNTALVLRRLQTVKLAVGILTWAMPPARVGQQDHRPTLMSRVVREPVPYGSPEFDRGVLNFRANLDVVIRRLTRSGVRVLIGELVSNIRDLRPLGSAPYAELPPADQVFEQGRTLEAAGRIDEARDAYTHAKDLDDLRFRAPERINAAIAEVAADYDVPVVAMKDVFESASPNRLPGNTLFVDHLHPNVDGYFLMAEAFFEAMQTNGFVDTDWSAQTVRPAAEFYRNRSVTELDREIGRLIVMDLMDYWPFMPLEVPGTEFADFEPTTPASEFAYRVARGELDFVTAHERLAAVYESRGDPDRARAEIDAIRDADPYTAK